MKMEWEFTKSEIVAWLGNPRSSGDVNGAVSGLADLAEATQRDISFLGTAKYQKYLASSRAGLILVPEGQAGNPVDGQLWVYCTNPSLALATVCERIEATWMEAVEPGVHPTAIIGDGAQIASSSTIGPYCIIESGARIGERVQLESQVRIGAQAVIGDDTIIRHGSWLGARTQVGERCLIHSGCVIGADGFGFHSDASGHRKIAQIGRVEIGNDVEIGANTTIDRARFSATRIGDGTKIDNLVQIGHNVEIGKHCIICAQVGIAGSTRLGNFVVFGGQVGVNGHIVIEDGVQVTAKSGIAKSAPAGTILGGTPARPRQEELRRLALVNKLPQWQERLNAMEKELQDLRARLK